MLAPVDVEAALVALLPDAGTQVPNPRPASFTRVSRAGGSGLNAVQSAVRVLVECWAPDSVAAFERARMAYGLLWAAQDSYVAPGVFVTRVELTEPVNFPDPATSEARYQFVAQLTTSLEEIA